MSERVPPLLLFPSLLPRASVGIPPRERILCADTETGNDERHPCAWNIFQWKQPAAAIEAEYGPALEEIRDIGTDGGRHPVKAIARQLRAPEHRQRSQRGGRIAA